MTLALLGIVLLCATGFGAMVLVFKVMKSSDVYKRAVAIAEADPAVAGELGSPIREGMFLSGNINVTNDSGNANLSIPISGPRSDAVIFAVAVKTSGKWNFTTLAVQVNARGKTLDLLNKNAAVNPPPPSP